jgi:hypothetical protein
MAAAEQKKSYAVVKQFRSLNTKANRTAIDESEFSWIENAQPIGYANLKIIPTSEPVQDSGGNAVVFSNTVTHLTSVNIGLNDYVVAFMDNGSAQYFNINTDTFGNVAAAGTFSSTGINTTQWNNERMLILDPSKGYFNWDGNNVVTIGSVGAIGIVNQGTGYTEAPTVTISGPDQSAGVQANATSFISTANVVTSVSLSNAGTGYTNAANLTVTFTGGGGGTGANAVAQLFSFQTGTLSLVVINEGSGYTNAANTIVTISGGGGAGATAVPIVVGNVVTQVIMTNQGSGYTNAANVTATVSGGGGNGAVLQAIVNSEPNVGIASFSGRVWIAAGRSVYYSAAGSYSDFTSVSAGSVTLTDSTLHGNIIQLLTANNFLYIFGDNSINVFSDVRVTNAGTTLFTNTNVSASVGSELKNAIFPYFRSVLFMNDYGVYALVGSTTSKLSDALDGVFPNIDFANPVYAGQVLLNNILCAVFNFRYFDSTFTNSYRFIQAVFFEKKWFISSQGNNIKYVTSVPEAGQIVMYGTSGNNLYRLYADTSSSIVSRVRTALMPMTDPIRTKQALKIGIEATAPANGTITMSATVDNENRSSSPYTLSSVITWQNNSLQVIPWSNNSGTNIGWGTSGYSLYKTDAQQYGKYLGITVTSTNPGYVINGFEFEHELRVRF